MAGPSRKRMRTLENPSITTLDTPSITTLDTPLISADDYVGMEEDACGVIESVTMMNFMCHEHLSADFNEKINLVQGRNGSGKSAILTAVVVALGGTTKTTNRGSSLKELIKYEKHTATVQITLKNSGRDAFKHETYGDKILIERKISEHGGNTYSLKAVNGKAVSSKKEELKRMVEFFNLNVENPLVVLNQDMSRSFLNSTDPKKLYKFFFQATQLQQMSDYYAELKDCLDSSSSIIKDRLACLPQMEREVKELNDRYQFCLKQKEKKIKLKELRRELAWAKIYEIEEQKESIDKELNECLEISTKIKDKRLTFQNQAEESKLKKKELENYFHSILEEIRANRINYKLKNDVQLKAKSEMKAMQREVDKETRRIDAYNKEIAALSETIKKDHTAAHQQWEEQHHQHQEEISAKEAEVLEVEQRKKTEETQLQNIKNTIQVKEENRQQLQFDCTRRERNINERQTELKNLQSQNTNAFTIFGTWVQPLLDRIDLAYRQRKFSAKPVGPVGAYIEIADPNWTHIAEMVIGGRISAFCVDNRSDEKVLRGLFRGLNFGSQYPMVICCRFRQRHNMDLISRNEVQSDTYKSLWSAMTIKNDVVANLIIDRCQVETVLLIPTSEEAGQILKNSNTVPYNCKIAYTLNGDKYFPDPNYKVYSGRGQARARFLQISVGERAQTVSSELGRIMDELEGIKQEVRNVDVEFSELRNQEAQSQLKLRKLRNSVQNLRGKLTQLSNEVGPIRPPNASQLEEEIRNQDAVRAKAVERLQITQEKLKSIEQEFIEAQKAFNEINSSLDSLTKSAKLKEVEMQNAMDNSNKIIHSNDLVQQKLKSYEKKIKEFEGKLAVIVKKLESEMKLMEDFMPRKESNRSSLEIERQYKNMEEKLNKEQEQKGDPVQIAEKYQQMKEKVEKMKAELEDSRNLVTKLNNALTERKMMGINFRKTLSILVKTSFAEALTNRHMKGKINFDFKNENLSISIQKEGGSSNLQDDGTPRMLKRNQQEKLSMMSGGERSFATVAFILALWEVVDSPIRILDEFDVFMDIVARRQSLDMMISAAKKKTQYIYLTPLEVNRNQYKTKLNVFRMPDPEREENTAGTSQ